MTEQTSAERILEQEIHTKMLPKEVPDSFKKVLKQGIFKELHHRKMLSDVQLNSLINKEK